MLAACAQARSARAVKVHEKPEGKASKGTQREQTRRGLTFIMHRAARGARLQAHPRAGRVCPPTLRTVPAVQLSDYQKYPNDIEANAPAFSHFPTGPPRRCHMIFVEIYKLCNFFFISCVTFYCPGPSKIHTRVLARGPSSSRAGQNAIL